MSEEIIKGNKLIAEFMKVETGLNSANITVYWYNNPEKGYLDYMLKYNSSWDWLIPVVEEIEKTQCTDQKTGNMFFPQINIGSVFCEITKSQKFIGEDWYVVSRCSDSKIKATWLSVVEFIEWYNKNR